MITVILLRIIFKNFNQNFSVRLKVLGSPLFLEEKVNGEEKRIIPEEPNILYMLNGCNSKKLLPQNHVDKDHVFFF